MFFKIQHPDDDSEHRHYLINCFSYDFRPILHISSKSAFVNNVATKTTKTDKPSNKLTEDNVDENIKSNVSYMQCS